MQHVIKNGKKRLVRAYVLKTIQVCEIIYDDDMYTSDEDAYEAAHKPLKVILEELDERLENCLEEFGGFKPLKTKIDYEMSDRIVDELTGLSE